MDDTAAASPATAATRLDGKYGLVIGVANAESIAFGCASAMRALGARLALTYLNDKSRPYVEPLARSVGASLYPLDVASPDQLDALFEALRRQWGRLDFVLHSVAFAPAADLHARLVDTSAQGFATAMDVSCHSFIRIARRAQALMPDGGTLITMTYQGAERVVQHYNLMGPVKAALQASVRYLADELGARRIRVLAVSPGPMRTRAAGGLKEFDALLYDARMRSPLRRLVTLEEVGLCTALLATDAAAAQTGTTIYIDGGHHIEGC